MSKKSIIKRALALGICLLLAIITLLLPNNKNVVHAGAGNGTNKKIQTTAELSALLEQVARQMEHGAEPLSLLSDSQSHEYESVTVEDTLRQTVIVHNGAAYSKSRVDRNMTAYFTKDVTYYVSEATISGDYYVPEQTDGGEVVQEEVYKKTDLSIRIHVYRGQEVCMLLFDRYSYILNGESHALPADALGKWIVFSPDDDYELYDEITSIDGHNVAVLSLMGEMLADESVFKRSGATYTMTDEAFLTFLAGLERIDGVSRATSEDMGKGRFTANLKNKRRPSVTLDFKDYYNATTTILDIAQTEELIFSNIDNTVIGEPSGKNTLTVEELGKFFEEWGE